MIMPTGIPAVWYELWELIGLTRDGGFIGIFHLIENETGQYGVLGHSLLEDCCLCEHSHDGKVIFPATDKQIADALPLEEAIRIVKENLHRDPNR